MNWRWAVWVAIAAIGLSEGPSWAATQMQSWQLSTVTGDFSGSTPMFGSYDINNVTNPLNQNTSSQVGLNRTTGDYDYSWLMNSIPATFNTSLTQTFRTRQIREVSEATFGFRLTAPAEFHIDSSLHFSHTPGDQNFVNWSVSCLNLTTNQSIFGYQYVGGGGTGHSPSGTYVINESHILPANDLLGFFYNLDSYNIIDPAPTGTMDISGYVNWTLTPEPSGLMMVVMVGGLCLMRRGRRCGITRAVAVRA